MFEFDDSKLVKIFYECDEFCKVFHPWWTSSMKTFPLMIHKNTSSLSESEIMSILIFYHYSGMRNFKWYYQRFVIPCLQTYYPNLVSYNRFIEILSSVYPHLYAFGNVWMKGEPTGTYFVDSTKLPVCHNKRIASHRVFKDIAQRGKTSVGWFYGLKLHLIINQLGEIMSFRFTPGNVSDKNKDLLKELTASLQGKMYGDKGYVSQPVFDMLIEQGLKLIYKLKKNMKNKLLTLEEKWMSKRRALIETGIDLLKNICNIDHTRHRNPVNAITHAMAGISAYQFFDQKPTIPIFPKNFLHKNSTFKG